MELHPENTDPRLFPLRGKTVTAPRGRRRIVLGPFRLFIVVVSLLVVGGFASIILLGPAEVRWLAQGGFNRPAMQRLWNSAPVGIPEDFLMHLRHGIVATRQGRSDEALAAFTAAVQADTNTHTRETLGVRADNSMLPETHLWRLDIQAHMERADVLRRMGRYDEALYDIDYALKLDGRHYENRELRGVVLLILNRPDDAIEEFTALLAMRESAQVMFARGLAKYVKRDWGAAAEDFALASERTPRSRKYAVWLADAKNRVGQTFDGGETIQRERIFPTVYTQGITGNAPGGPAQPLSGQSTEK